MGCVGHFATMAKHTEAKHFKREKRQFLSFAVGLGLGDYCLLAFSDKIVKFELFGIQFEK